MRARIFAAGITAALGLATPDSSLAAQEWRVSAHGGRMRSSLDPVALESFALGLQYNDATSSLRLTGGVPIRSDDPLRGGVSAWKRLSVRRSGLLAGVDFAGNAFAAVDRAGQPARPAPGLFTPPSPIPVDRSGHALAGQAMPVLGYEGANFQLHARAGASRYSASFGKERQDRSVRLADLQLTLTPTGALAIVPVVRRFETSTEAAATFAGVSALIASPTGNLWASVGRWAGGAHASTPWSIGGRVALLRLVSLEGGVRHDTYDPLYLQPAQTSWSVGLSVLLGARARTVAAPVPAAYVNGRATIRLAGSSAATSPSIAGDFNAWTPEPMQREGDHWVYTTAVPRGVYNYSFVAADGTWFVPKDVPGRKADGMGGHVAVLVVR